jgi:arylsulfatase A-like enzyme
MPGRGNVLFITVDQWRGDCLSIAGHPVVQTPTLDALARRGVRFANHWSNTAPCGPSRATLLTGLYAQNHRSILNGTPLDDRFTNVAREARAAGFDPVLFGYTDTSLDPTGRAPDDPALRTYESPLPGFRPVVELTEDIGPWLAWLAERGYDVPERQTDIYQPDRTVPGADERGPTWAPARYAAEHTETAFLTEAVLDFLDGWRRDPETATEPWFVHLSYLRPHPPYLAPAPYHDRYDPADVPPPRRRATRREEASLHPLLASATRLVGAPESDRDVRQLRATYYGMMAEVDDQLARVVDWLDRTGEADRTLVVLTSDHGEQAGDHWLVEKLAWFDESFHVPLIVCDPDAPPAAAGRTVEAFTEHVDITPTICEWLGLEVPLQCDGRPLQPFLGDQATTPDDWRTEVHWEWDFRDPVTHGPEDWLGTVMEHCCLNVVRDHRWKYVHFAADEVPNLLFDLEADPDQFENRVDDPACAGVVADQAGKLLSWRMRHDERTWTGTVLGPDGMVVRRDPRRV